MRADSASLQDNHDKADDKKVPRKRNRIPVACGVCRKRKVKCDRGRPHCDVCRRYNVAHLCSYQEPSWTRKISAGNSSPPSSSQGNGSDFSDNYDNVIGDRRPIVPADSRRQEDDFKSGAYPTRFDNNINNLINHSTRLDRSLGFDDNTAQFKNYRNINTVQSSERSTANFPDAWLSPRPDEQRQLLPSFTQSSRDVVDSVSPAIQTELERMKQKIKEIEASITLSRTFSLPPAHKYPDILPKITSDSVHGDRIIRAESEPVGHDVESSPLLTIGTPIDDEPHKAHDNLWEPHIDLNDVIDFYSDYISVQVRQSKLTNHGPLSWLTILKRDRFLRIFWVKIIDLKNSNNIFPQNLLKRKRCDIDKNKEPLSTDKLDLPSDEYTLASERKQEKLFREKMLEEEGFNDIEPFDNEIQKKRKISFGCDDRERQTEMAFVKRIEDNLPTKKVIWLCLDRFFKFIYPLFPCVDQEMFLEDTRNIIGERSLDDVRVKSITIEKRLGFATVGQLLLFVRLGYLTVTNNCLTVEFLQQNPVGPDIAVIAQSCLDKFQLSKKTSLAIFQLAFYMRLYHCYAPEGGDITPGGDSMVFGGLLTLMGFSLGLNRDPLTFGINEKMVGLWRKTWAMLLLSDAKVSNSMGVPSVIREEHFDTQPPTVAGEKYSNHQDLELEKISIGMLNERLKWNLKLKEITGLVCNLKESPKLSVIVAKLKDFEFFISSEFGNLNKIMTVTNNNHIDNLVKVKKISSYLELQTSVQVIYHFVFMHMEAKKDFQAATYFLKKNLTIISEIIFNFIPLTRDLHKYVGEGFEIYITPKAGLAIHRTLQMQLALFLRSQHWKCSAKLQNSLTPELTSALDNFCKVIFKNLDIYRHGLSKLRTSYYFAWRKFRQQVFVIEVLKKYYDSIFQVGGDMRIHTTLENSIINAPSCNIFQGISIKDIEALANILDFQYFKQNASIETQRLFDFDDLINSLIAQEIDYVTTKDNNNVDNTWIQLTPKSLNPVEESSSFGNELDFDQPNFDSLFSGSYDLDIFDSEFGATLTLI